MDQTSPRRKMIPLYNSQGVETVFVVTGSGGNSYKMHGMNVLVVLIGWRVYKGNGISTRT